MKLIQKLFRAHFSRTYANPQNEHTPVDLQVGHEYKQVVIAGCHSLPQAALEAVNAQELLGADWQLTSVHDEDETAVYLTVDPAEGS